jgi:hypothetical protein
MATARSPGSRELRGQGGGMNGIKVTTMRLPEGMAAQLAAIARTEGVPVSEFVRQAIEDRMVSTLAGEGFKERMKRRILRVLGRDRPANQRGGRWVTLIPASLSAPTSTYWTPGLAAASKSTPGSSPGQGRVKE